MGIQKQKKERRKEEVLGTINAKKPRAWHTIFKLQKIKDKKLWKKQRKRTSSPIEEQRQLHVTSPQKLCK